MYNSTVSMRIVYFFVSNVYRVCVQFFFFRHPLHLRYAGSFFYFFYFYVQHETCASDVRLLLLNNSSKDTSSKDTSSKDTSKDVQHETCTSRCTFVVTQ